MELKIVQWATNVDPNVNSDVSQDLVFPLIWHVLVLPKADGLVIHQNVLENPAREYYLSYINESLILTHKYQAMTHI